MTKLRLIRQNHLNTLREDINKNINIYKHADIEKLPDPKESTFEIDIEANLDALKRLDPSSDYKTEANNSLIVYNCLRDIKPDLARDERLWAYLTHYYALDYTSKRWPVSSEETSNPETHIRTHYFGKTNRAIERDNSISRLWWIAHITNKSTSGNIHDNLTSLLFRSDVRSSFIERPSTSRNVNLLTALLEELRDAYKIYDASGDLGIFERKKFRALMVKLNEVGGYKLLDSLSVDTLKNIISQ